MNSSNTVDLLDESTDEDDSSVELIHVVAPPRSNCAPNGDSTDADSEEEEEDSDGSEDREERRRQRPHRYALHTQNDARRKMFLQVIEINDDDEEDEVFSIHDSSDSSDQSMEVDDQDSAQTSLRPQGGHSDANSDNNSETHASILDDRSICSIPEYDSSDDELAPRLEKLLGLHRPPLLQLPGQESLPIQYWDRVKALAQKAKEENKSLKELTRSYWEDFLQRQPRNKEPSSSGGADQESDPVAAPKATTETGACIPARKMDHMKRDFGEKQDKPVASNKKPRRELLALTDSLTVPPKNMFRRPWKSSQHRKESATDPAGGHSVSPNTSKVASSDARSQNEANVARDQILSLKPEEKKTEIIFERPITYRTVDISFEDKEEYTEVQVLSSLILDPKTKLPVKKMTLHKPGSDVVLYDLQVTVKQSTIPNGGNGAFLKFIGARRLTKKALERRKQLMRKYERRKKQPTEDILHAISATGHGVSVKLSGDCLGHGLSDFVHKKDGRPPPHVAKGFGLLGILTERDYEPAPNLLFQTTNNFVILGTYGPFRKADRVTDEMYTLKNLLFSNGPAEYGFGVPENIFDSNLRHIYFDVDPGYEGVNVQDRRISGRGQVIDITDDFGRPHDIARRNIPMHVNECSPRISYDERLNVKNVHVVDRYERGVDYLLYLPYKINAGDEVELFTEYGESYNDMRERQGYSPQLGKKPDTHFPSRLERDNDIRRNSKETIMAANSFPELTDLISWTHEIWEKLQKVRQPESRLIVAMVRIQWLLGLYQRKLKHLVKNYDVILQINEPKGSIEWYRQIAVRLCKDMIKAMRLDMPEKFFSKISQEALEIALKESQEQVLYEISHILIWPCDESVWAEMGSALLRKAALWIAKGRLKLASWDIVLEKLYTLPAEALALSNEQENLVFESGLREYDRNAFDIDENTEIVLRVINANQHSSRARCLFNCQTPKALIARAMGTAGRVATDNVDIWNGMFVMTDGAAHHAGDMKEMASFPRLASDSSAKFNLLWYKVWQIGFPTLTFLEYYFKRKHANLPHLSHISNQLGVDASYLLHACRHGMPESAIEMDDDSIFQTATGERCLDKRKIASGSRKSSAEKRRVYSRRGNSPTEIYNGPPTKKLVCSGRHREWPPGWTEKQFMRKGGQTAGYVDFYWFTPQLGKRIRSLVHVFDFLEMLEAHNGDEVAAWRPRFSK